MTDTLTVLSAALACFDFVPDPWQQTTFLLFLYLLLDEIVREFQNQSVQQEWNKFRASVLARRDQRHKHLTEAALVLEQQRQVAAAERQQRMQQLDTAIDEMNAKFADEAVALEYDANALIQRFETKKVNGVDKVRPCLGPRAHWMDCANKYSKDTRPCDAYMDILEKCVKDAIVNSTTTASSSPSSS